MHGVERRVNVLYGPGCAMEAEASAAVGNREDGGLAPFAEAGDEDSSKDCDGETGSCAALGDNDADD